MDNPKFKIETSLLITLKVAHNYQKKKDLKKKRMKYKMQTKMFLL